MDFDNNWRLVRVDLEMTGLDVDKDHIIEMAVLITDPDLNIIAEGPDIIINQPESILQKMGDWCKEQHGKSGLTKAVQVSRVTLNECEKEMIGFVSKYTNKEKCLLAGNTVHVDKEFLKKYMPDFMSLLHYRIIDVSTVKELCRAWYPLEYANAPKKINSHRALADIRESVDELKYYRKAIFKSS
ncbi:oligoribonuclease, mitochondrial isoform X3 [Hydra vulgaris]|uniref:Oligoribonuclease, mitochondrial isoform X3 n=1 Tax=Hydra vulgaris TaxID=6087 RepID=A0ABM4CJN2_HYDVU